MYDFCYKTKTSEFVAKTEIITSTISVKFSSIFILFQPPWNKTCSELVNIMTLNFLEKIPCLYMKSLVGNKCY
jgi:hypothetical protein